MIGLPARLKTRTIAITSGVVILIVFVVTCYFVLYGSDVAARATLRDAKSTATSNLQHLNGVVSDDRASIADKQNAVDRYITALVTIQATAICPQKTAFYYRFLPSRTGCDDKAQKLQSTIISLQSLRDYLRDEAALANSVAPLTKTDASFGDMQVYWNDVSQKISHLSIKSSVAPLRTVLAKALANYSEAWGTLSAANDAKDKTAFEAATQQLDVCYQAIEKIHVVDETKLSERQKAAQVAYAAYLQ